MSAGGKNYIPRNDFEFCTFANIVYNYASEHHDRWKVVAPTMEMKERLADLMQKVAQCKTSDRRKVDTTAKNDAKKVVEKDLRTYIQGLVARNSAVTDRDRENMNLPVYGKSHPIGEPVGTVSAGLKFPNTGAVELHIRHDTGTPFDKRANYGVRIKYGIFPFEAPNVVNASQLNESRFTRRKKILFTFGQDDKFKKVVFCLCYENSKGMTGQWGQFISAIIQ